MLADLQRDLVGWLLRGDREPAAAWLAPDLPATRLDIHRNTVLGLLAEVLATAFPVTRQVVGEAFFAAVGQRFAAARPPARPALWGWGGGFSDFLAGFPPAAGLPYLPDLARLEWAMNAAYFAIDAEALDARRLAALPVDRLAGLAFQPHPSLALVRSRWAIHSLWAAHQPGGAPAGLDPAGRAETVLVHRQGAAVRLRLLEGWEANFLAALADNRPLGEAFAACPAPAPRIQAALASLIADGVFVGYALAAADTIAASSGSPAEARQPLEEFPG